MSIEAMKQALEALEICAVRQDHQWHGLQQVSIAKAALRQALSEAQLSVNENSHSIEQAEKRHYCPEWDFLEITKDDPEFEACLCFSQKPDAWVADVGEPPTEEEKQEHITDGSTCWCGPETNYTDSETGASVIVHRKPQ